MFAASRERMRKGRSNCPPFQNNRKRMGKRIASMKRVEGKGETWGRPRCPLQARILVQKRSASSEKVLEPKVSTGDGKEKVNCNRVQRREEKKIMAAGG